MIKSNILRAINVRAKVFRAIELASQFFQYSIFFEDWFIMAPILVLSHLKRLMRTLMANTGACVIPKTHYGRNLRKNFRK